MQAALVERPFKTSAERSNLIDHARQLLEGHPHFRGRADAVAIRQRGKTLYLSGRLPTFYLKQLAQEIVRHLPGIHGIRNEIDVVSPYGISSER